ncbi:MAG: exopolyphosphatase, partial [Haemophilus parainfluenzae]
MDMFATGDLGSNSFRLTISKNIDGQYQMIDSLKEMIHFAAGLDKNRFLDKAAEERALDCLKKFGERLRGFKESQVRIVATNTFRIAKNIDDFLPKAEKAIGFPIEIIGGREESRLIYTGVLHTEAFHGQKVLIIDIGGGSTEFAIGAHENPEARMKLQSIRQELIAAGWQIAVGSSGTAKTLYALKNAQDPEATSFDYDFLMGLKNLIVEKGSVEKSKLKEIKANRTEVFAGGLAIMIALFEELGIKEMRTTEAGLRDGVLFEFSGRSLDKDLKENTVESFANRYQVNKVQAKTVGEVALTLFTLLQESHFVLNDPLYARRIIRWAAALHEIGLFISHTVYHKHSAYILANADMPGFSRTDQIKLAL